MFVLVIIIVDAVEDRCRSFTISMQQKNILFTRIGPSYFVSLITRGPKKGDTNVSQMVDRTIEMLKKSIFL